MDHPATDFENTFLGSERLCLVHENFELHVKTSKAKQNAKLAINATLPCLYT